MWRRFHTYEDDFTRSIRERDDVILIEISTENHEEREKFTNPTEDCESEKVFSIR